MRSDYIDTEGHLVERRGRVGPSLVLGRVGQVIDYLFGVLYVLLLVRFALAFFGANAGSGFFQLVREATDVFYAPFNGIFAATAVGHGYLEWSLLVCLFGYMVLHALIRGLLRLLARA
jgi:YGGT family